MAVEKGHPMWCRVYARKTPTIPVHNGLDKCIGCGFDVKSYRMTLADALRDAKRAREAHDPAHMRRVRRPGAGS